MKRDLNHFLLSGLMAAHAARDLEASGVLRGRAVTSVERAEQDLFAPVQEHIRTGSLEMQRVYRVLYVLENIVRDFIDVRFREVDQTSDWFEGRASSDMKRKLEQRRAAEEKNQWHSGRNRHPLFYMDFGDLAKLIITHWSVFEDLPGQTWVQSRLDEAERSRNVIAHTNLLTSEEASRLQMHLRDWLRQIA